MIILPERHYCVIENPIIMEKGKPFQDKYGQYQVQLGEIEIRFQKDYSRPFLLYPNEVLVKPPTELRIIKEMSALKIEALRNCVDSNGVKR